jgi:hypothetical protein
MVFTYAGDQGSRTLAWLGPHLKGIALSLENELPEQALNLIYSGIDTLGLLGAVDGITDATRSTFMPWCETYILPRVQSVEGAPLTAVDLYAARCGVLHTSTPASALGRRGDAREIWYQFRGRTGINMLCDLPVPALRIDVEVLAWAFREGALAFVADIQKDPAKLQMADNRAQHFLRWGIVELDHLTTAVAPVTTRG